AGAVPTIAPASQITGAIACLDVDLDGWNDLVLSISPGGPGGGLLFWLNQQNGTFADVTASRMPILPTVSNPTSFPGLYVADFNHDGYPDIDVFQPSGGDWCPGW